MVSSPIFEKTLTLRLLNSPLCGCEFELTNETSMFVVAATHDLTNSAQLRDNAFIIPMEDGGINFEIIKHSLQELTVSVREITDDGKNLIRSIGLNEIITIGSLRIALKISNSLWEIDLNNLSLDHKVENKKLIIRNFNFLIVIIITGLSLLFYFRGGFATTMSTSMPLSDTNIINTYRPSNRLVRPSVSDLEHNLKIERNNYILTADQAESRLRAMSIPFTRKDDDKATKFIVAGLIGDEEIQEIKSLNLDAKKSRVYFSINLKDDLMTGRSYLYGNNSYIKLSPNHWLVNN